MGKTRTALTALFAIVLAALFACALSGCSGGGHQIVDSANACVECHSDDKATFEDATPQGAEQVSSALSVSTSADAVAVCKPLYTAEDGSSYVPVLVKSVQASDGTASLQLDEGTWVIAIDNGDSATTKLVTVADGGADSIEL